MRPSRLPPSRLLLALLLAHLPTLAVAQDRAPDPEPRPKTMLVVPFDTSQTPGKLDHASLVALEDAISDAAVRVLGPQGWAVTSGRALMYMEEEEGPDAEGALELARSAGVEKYVYGALRVDGSEISGTLRVYDTSKGNVIASKNVSGKTILELKNAVDARVAPLFVSGSLISKALVTAAPEAPPAPAPAPPPTPAPPIAPVAKQRTGIAAVLPLNVAGTAIDDQTKRALDETIQSFVAKSLSDYGYTVLDSDTTLRYLDENGISAEKVCTANCALAAAKELKASLYLSGSVSKSEGEFVALLRIYTASSNGRVLNVVHLEGASVREIRKAFESQVADFVSKAVAKLD